MGIMGLARGVKRVWGWAYFMKISSVFSPKHAHPRDDSPGVRNWDGKGLGSRVWCLVFRVQGWDLKCRVQGWDLRVGG